VGPASATTRDAGGWRRGERRSALRPSPGQARRPGPYPPPVLAASRTEGCGDGSAERLKASCPTLPPTFSHDSALPPPLRTHPALGPLPFQRQPYTVTPGGPRAERPGPLRWRPSYASLSGASHPTSPRLTSGGASRPSGTSPRSTCDPRRKRREICRKRRRVGDTRTWTSPLLTRGREARRRRRPRRLAAAKAVGARRFLQLRCTLPAFRDKYCDRIRLETSGESPGSSTRVSRHRPSRARPRRDPPPPICPRRPLAQLPPATLPSRPKPGVSRPTTGPGGAVAASAWPAPGPTR